MDGQFGNGPDSLIVSHGDSLIVDVWIEGDGFGPDFIGFGVFIVDNGTLDLVTGEVYPSSWTPLPITEDGDTVYTGAFDMSLSGIWVSPFHAASLVYEVAAESGFGSLEVDLINSIWHDNFAIVTFDGSVGAHLEIQGTSATGESSWGDVKQLFR